MASTELRTISADEIMRPSSRFPITLQDSGMPVLEGMLFSSDELAVAYKLSQRPNTYGKVEIPLELPMQAGFNLADPQSSNRLDTDFRIQLADRVIAPAGDESCAVLPYFLYNGIVSLMLRVTRPEDEPMFDHDSFFLSIFEPGVSQPFSGVTDAIMQITIPETIGPPEETLARYLALKERAGNTLEKLFNTRIAAA